MSRGVSTQTIAFLVILLLALGVALYAREHSRVAAIYYAKELAQAQTVENVVVSGNTYTVEHGLVLKAGRPIGGPLAWRAQKLAYQVTLARRDPLLAIPGTDPDALTTQLNRLELAQKTLADAQTSPANAALIANLYPTAFLHSVAMLERIRQRLLAHPTEEVARIYNKALLKTASLRSANLNAFTDAFAQATGNNVTVAQFGGLISKNTQLRVLFGLQDDAVAVEQEALRRARCTTGSVDFCEAIQAATLPNTEPFIAKPDALTQEIAWLWNQTYGTTTPRTIVLIPSSACVAAPGPHRLTLSTRQLDGTPVRTLSYADTIFFVDTSTLPLPFWDYARNELGISYAPVTPFSYYSCPRIGIDFGTALATERIDAFVKTQPQPGIQTEHALQELALMFKKRTAGLEYIVADIVHVIQVGTSKPRDEWVDISARYEFLTHSAFPTFFRIGASSDTIFESLYAQDAGATEGLTSQLVPYDIARQLVGRQALIEDMAAYLRLENRLKPGTPSTTPATTSQSR